MSFTSPSLASLAKRLIHFVFGILYTDKFSYADSLLRRADADIDEVPATLDAFVNFCSLFLNPIPADLMVMYCLVRKELQNASAAKSITSLN